MIGPQLRSATNLYKQKSSKFIRSSASALKRNPITRKSPKLVFFVISLVVISLIWWTAFSLINFTFGDASKSFESLIKKEPLWKNWIAKLNTTKATNLKEAGVGGQWTWCTHLVKYGPNFDQGLAAFISGILQPKSTLEFGCGIGMYINYIQHNSAAKDKDNSRFIGIEPESMMGAGVFGSEPYLAQQAAMNIFEVDQSVLDSFGTFEVVFSSEVAEHIPFDLHETMIDFLVNKTEKYLVFGAARRGQGGTGHIAMRNQEDWIKDFQKKGMIHSDLLSERVKAAAWNGWDKGRNTFVMINAEYHKQFHNFDNQFQVFKRKNVGSIFPQFQGVYDEMIEKDTCNVTKLEKK